MRPSVQYSPVIKTNRGWVLKLKLVLYLQTEMDSLDWLTDWLTGLIMSMGVRLCLNCDHQRASCSSPDYIWAWETMVKWWCRQRKSPDSSTRALWQSYQQNLLGASRRKGRKKWEFYLVTISFNTDKWFFTCGKILHGASGFPSHPKKAVLRIFVAFKIPSPRRGLNSQPLGTVASKLITTSPKRPNQN
jgi:hypothetical protein